MLRAAKAEVNKFNERMKQVIKREEDRLEKEHGHVERRVPSLDFAPHRSDSLTVEKEPIELSPLGSPTLGSPGHTPYPNMKNEKVTRTLLKKSSADIANLNFGDLSSRQHKQVPGEEDVIWGVFI